MISSFRHRGHTIAGKKRKFAAKSIWLLTLILSLSVPLRAKSFVDVSHKVQISDRLFIPLKGLNHIAALSKSTTSLNSVIQQEVAINQKLQRIKSSLAKLRNDNEFYKFSINLFKRWSVSPRNSIVLYSFQSFFLIIFAGFFISRKNSHPIAEIVKKLEEMSQKPIGEWGLLQVQGDDKVKRIADFINNLIVRYRRLLASIQSSTDKLIKARSQLLNESSHLNRGIKDIDKQANLVLTLGERFDDSYQDLSAAAQYALTSIEQTRSMVEEAFYSIKRMDEDLAIWMDSAKKISTSIVKLDTGFDRILEEIEEVNPRIIGINSSLRSMDKSLSQLDINTKELSTSAAKTAVFIEQMEKSIDNINTISHSLSRAADETSNLMAKMAYSIQLIESNAKKSRELSEIVASDVEKGMNAIRKTIEGMDRINKAVEETSQVIKRLGVRSQEIGEILNVIDDIAEQTNLLALNASIIAAQAGEQGKGFAVVADEIRGLAARTSSSTQDIGKLILSVQEEVRNAVQSMKEGSAKVEEGVKLSNQAGKIFEKILEGTRNSTEMVKKIAEATVEQADSSSQAVEAIKEVTKMIQNISKATTGHISSLPEINKVVDSLSSMAKDISQAITSLQEHIEHIKEAMSIMKEKSLEISRGTKKQKREEGALSSLISQTRDREELIAKLIDQLTKNIGDIRINFKPLKQKLNLLNSFKSKQQAYKEKLSNYFEDINYIAQMQMKIAGELREGCFQSGQASEDISQEQTRFDEEN